MNTWKIELLYFINLFSGVSRGIRELHVPGSFLRCSTGSLQIEVSIQSHLYHWDGLIDNHFRLPSPLNNSENFTFTDVIQRLRETGIEIFQAQLAKQRDIVLGKAFNN